MSTTYTLEQLTLDTLNTPEVRQYLDDITEDANNKFRNDVNFKNTNYEALVKHGFFIICRRNNEITGHMIAQLYRNCFDMEVKVLNQVSLYVKPNSGRTAWYLFQKFIDIGKSQANYIFTMLRDQTNIKPSTLEKMGFKYAETVYRMEVK